MRLFLALEVSEREREQLRAVQDRLRPICPGWRWLDPAHIHLTLRFLGEVDDASDQEQRAGWRAMAQAHACLTLRIGSLGVLPPGSRARVLCAEVVESVPPGSLAALAGALEAVARGAGFEAARQPFRPHLTLARALRTGSRARPPDAPGSIAIDVPCSAVTLFRSVLSSQGAVYTALERFPLRPFGLDPAGPARQHAHVTERSSER